MIRAVIFDMDGVMVDTEHVNSKAFEDILAEYGVTPEKNEHGTVHVSGATTAETWELLKAKYGFEADTEELTQKKRRAILSALEQGVYPMPGLLGLLKDLRNSHIILGVATSAQRDRATFVLDKLGIASYFNAVISANDVAHGKPAPDPYLKAAEHLGVPPEDCIVIEDAEMGVASAKAAGMKVIAVPNEYTKRMDFSNAALVANSLEELNTSTIRSLA